MKPALNSDINIGIKYRTKILLLGILYSVVNLIYVAVQLFMKIIAFPIMEFSHKHYTAWLDEISMDLYEREENE